MALTLPSTLKLATLKQLAFKCGISTSGTKPILTQRLIDEITGTTLTPSPPTRDVSTTPKTKEKTKTKKSIRILSIDMGIRNLAYCILDVPPPKPKSLIQPLPTIQSWHRLSVSSAPTSSQDPEAPIPKESFTPPTLSSIAYKLLRTRLLTQKPTHILIERQRFRSMGSKHILEWTIRVNTFEAILYAILHTLKAEGIWEGDVHAIAPGKVGPFWVGEEEEEVRRKARGKKEEGDGEEKAGSKKERKSKSMKIIHKGLKMDLVKGWLEKGDVVKLGNEDVEAMAKAYREKWDRLPGGPRGKRKVKGEGEGEQDKMGKLDDLADSLLQGMAWIEWERNKRIVLSKGYEALLKP